MSRLTSTAPFNRPTVSDILRRPAPLTPPETEMESIVHAGPNREYADDDKAPPESQASHHESPTARFRRVSAIAYNSSMLGRERVQRDRVQTQRSKWLVVVSPPPSLNQEPALLGHTLSAAPAGRYSHGILIPLFPTLYGQLTAVAREFNMPSTTGVCIYLQLSDANMPAMITPRISDESWQLLWSHFFQSDEQLSPMSPMPSHGLPIAGRIEFDIDLRKARWFDAWMGHAKRDDVPLSREPSLVPGHWRAGSRASLPATDVVPIENEFLNQPDVEQPRVPNATIQRPLPKPLLLERTTSLRSSRHTSRAPSIATSAFHEESNATPRPSNIPSVLKALSPVPQALEVEEPQTARRVSVDNKVREWRDSASVAAGKTARLGATGQTSLDPVNLPNNMPDKVLPPSPDEESEFNLDDFDWSISSAGPPLDSPLSPNWPSPAPSVHLVGRLEGSVCLTPSVCTSWGPEDLEWPESPISWASRRPSPDLGMRMLDFAPLTPSTATSWGPPDTPLFSEDGYELEYTPSVDLGVRGMGSRPLTPTTATSWGPADTPFSVPSSPWHIRTPDIGERSFVLPTLPTERCPEYPDFIGLYPADHSRPRVAQNKVQPTNLPRNDVYPFIQIYDQVYPYNVGDLYPATRTIHSVEKCREYPDFAGLYPADNGRPRVAEIKFQHTKLHRGYSYPFIQIYEKVYPYNLGDLYPAIRTPHSGERSQEYPDFAGLYPTDHSRPRVAQNKVQHTNLPRNDAYPFIRIYGKVYPYNVGDLYPATRTTHSVERAPDFAGLYPVDHSRPLVADIKVQQTKVHRSYSYPSIQVYEKVYPYNLGDLYPTAHADDISAKNISLLMTSQSKSNLPEYPDFAGLYPESGSATLIAQNKSRTVSLDAAKNIVYPALEIYPARYTNGPAGIHISGMLPWLNVWPYNSGTTNEHIVSPWNKVWPYRQDTTQEDTVLPWNKVWPYRSGAAGGHAVSPWDKVWPYRSEVSHEHPVAPWNKVWPYMNRAAYEHATEVRKVVISNAVQADSHPWNKVWPYVAERTSSSRTETTNVEQQLCDEYPDFAALYPSRKGTKALAENKSRPVLLGHEQGYPFLTIYPSMYPHHLQTIYPATHPTVGRQPWAHVWPYRMRAKVLQSPMARSSAFAVLSVPQAAYPSLTIYPPVYPFSMDNIYPSLTIESHVPRLWRHVWPYNLHLELAPEYPHFASLYPASGSRIGLIGECKRKPVNLRSGTISKLSTMLDVNVGYPTFLIYPAPSGYPTFAIYPTTEPALNATPRGPRGLNPSLPSSYPYITLYDPVYPNFRIYPDTCATSTSSPRITTKATIQGVPKPSSRPEAQLETPRHSGSVADQEPVRSMVSSAGSDAISHLAPRRSKKSHHELHVAVFGKQSRRNSPQDSVPELPSQLNPGYLRSRTRSSTATSRSSRVLSIAAQDVVRSAPSQPIPDDISVSPDAAISPVSVGLPVRAPLVQSFRGATLPGRRSRAGSVLAPPQGPPPSIPPPTVPPPTTRPPIAPTVSVLSRVHSMNTPQSKRVAPGDHSLDRSSTLPHVKPLQRRDSAVLELTRLWDSVSSMESCLDDSRPAEALKGGRVNKIDRSKLPFA